MRQLKFEKISDEFHQV